jgi:lipoyl(octanoyl) transferase
MDARESLQIRRMGLVPYALAHALQVKLLRECALSDGRDTLLLLEHPPVITLGRGTDRSNLLHGTGIPVVEVERGGDVTLHGPGQLVGYLIRRLEGPERDLHRHLRLLEEILIQALLSFGLAAQRRPGATGVWIRDRKIASIGVACRAWCTWHGFALNVANDLGLFAAIRPCGFSASVMTSVELETGRPASLGRAMDLVDSAARNLVPARIGRRGTPA